MSAQADRNPQKTARLCVRCAKTARNKEILKKIFVKFAFFVCIPRRVWYSMYLSEKSKKEKKSDDYDVDFIDL